MSVFSLFSNTVQKLQTEFYTKFDRNYCLINLKCNLKDLNIA